jgi:hypothetical protein
MTMLANDEAVEGVVYDDQVVLVSLRQGPQAAADSCQTAKAWALHN